MAHLAGNLDDTAGPARGDEPLRDRLRSEIGSFDTDRRDSVETRFASFERRAVAGQTCGIDQNVERALRGDQFARGGNIADVKRKSTGNSARIGDRPAGIVQTRGPACDHADIRARLGQCGSAGKANAGGGPGDQCALAVRRKDGVCGSVMGPIGRVDPRPWVQSLLPGSPAQLGRAESISCKMKSWSFRSHPIAHIPAAIAAQPDTALIGMADKHFENAQVRAIGPDLRCGRVSGDTLIAMCFQEFSDPKPASTGPGLFRVPRAIGADHLVTIGDNGARSEEERALAVHLLQIPAILTGHHLHMFTGHVIRHRQHLVMVVAADHLAVVAPARGGGLGGGEDGPQAVDVCKRRLGPPDRIVDQASG